MENFYNADSGVWHSTDSDEHRCLHAGRNPGTGRRRDAWYWFPGRSCTASAADIQV